MTDTAQPGNRFSSMAWHDTCSVLGLMAWHDTCSVLGMMAWHDTCSVLGLMAWHDTCSVLGLMAWHDTCSMLNLMAWHFKSPAAKHATKTARLGLAQRVQHAWQSMHQTHWAWFSTASRRCSLSGLACRRAPSETIWPRQRRCGSSCCQGCMLAAL